MYVFGVGINVPGALGPVIHVIYTPDLYTYVYTRHDQTTQTVWCPNSAWDLFLIKGLGFSEWKLGMLALTGMALGALGYMYMFMAWAFELITHPSSPNSHRRGRHGPLPLLPDGVQLAAHLPGHDGHHGPDGLPPGTASLMLGVLSPAQKERRHSSDPTRPYPTIQPQLILVFRVNAQWGLSDFLFALGDGAVDAMVEGLHQMPINIM